MRGVRRFELVIVAALLVSVPSLDEAFSGGIAVTTALFRIAAALAVCWAVGAVVEATLDGYARQARQKELAERIEAIRAAQAASWKNLHTTPEVTVTVPPPAIVNRSDGPGFQ